MLNIQKKTIFAGMILVLGALLGGAILFVYPQITESQGTAGPITGYAWSDTTGWISLSGGTYGLTAGTDGTITGYAWSDNLGWISANAADLTGCPVAPCSARISGGAFAGWLRAIAGNTAQSGGWDGFISLSGAGYGVTQVGNVVDGYAWGDTNVGWVDFNAQTTYEACSATQGYYCSANVSMHRSAQCVETVNQDCSLAGAGWFCGDNGLCVAPPAPSCVGGTCLTLTPRLIAPGQRVQLSWNVIDASSCTVTEDNPDVTDSWNALSLTASSSPLSQATTYTLTCTGDGGNLTDSATVSLRPAWTEI